MERSRHRRGSSRAFPSTLSSLLLLSIVTHSAASTPVANQWELHFEQKVAAGANDVAEEGSAPETSPWGTAYRLSQCNDSEYHSLVWPLAQMVANTYRFPAVVPVPGWRVSKRVPPLGNSVGLHAIVYEEEAAPSGSRRVVVAFRGTQISVPPSLGSLCDLCADAFLYNDPDQWMPLYCYLLPRTLYDYFHGALPFVQAVVSAYSFQSPGTRILLTGHSLGGSLATIVSSYFATNTSFGWRFPVVTFSGGGTRAAHLARGVPLPPNDDPRLHNILDVWDPFFQAHSGNQVGVLCLYAPEEPEVCHQCYGNGSFPPPQEAASVPMVHRGHWRPCDKPGNQGVDRSWDVRMLLQDHALGEERKGGWRSGRGGDSSSYDCMECFFAAHFFRHILDLVRNSSRPLCQPAPLPQAI